MGLNTLLSLIETAGLVDALSGGDALTVFAPTDAALKRFIDGLPSAPGMSIVEVILMSYLNILSASVINLKALIEKFAKWAYFEPL